jgi:hypothetical protein
MKYIAVRDDLKLLSLDAEESESGAMIRTKKQDAELNRFTKGHKWEWFPWVMAGVSQIGRKRLKGKLLHLHHDLWEQIETVGLLSEKAKTEKA